MKNNLENDAYLKIKITEYKVAIEKYNTSPWYRRVEILSSLIVISLQILTLILLFHQYVESNLIALVMTIVISYIATDFINGLVHMIMDNNTHYTSIIGPFIAAFHLHHSKLIYQTNNSAMLYFNESGRKFWLVFYLAILFLIQCCVHMNFYLALFLVGIGLFSCFAELSHFWCHNGRDNNSVIQLLQRYKILLSMDHHKFHHNKDNTHYAFLNGMTDCALNLIAHYFYQGYKNRADKHIL